VVWIFVFVFCLALQLLVVIIAYHRSPIRLYALQTHEVINHIHLARADKVLTN
jgi:hypothetical protein